jgi:iron complex outermembrane receptor protein
MNARHDTTLALAITLALSGSIAQAQVLEEIVVTAQKREQKIQDLPMSVIAYSGDSVAELGITNSEQLVQHIVNFNVSSAVGEGARPAYFIRGVGLNDFNTNNAGPVGVYLDEVYMSSIASQMVPLFDVERVEVLRGPQGTLFGRNTSAGAVSFYSVTPGEELNGYGKAEIANFGSRRFEGAVGGGLSDKVSGRISAVKYDSDGFIENRAGPGQEGARDVLAWRAQLAITASDSFDVLLNLHGGRDRSQPNGYKHLGLLDPETFAPCSQQAIVSRSCVDVIGYRDTSSDLYSGEYDFSHNTVSDTDGGMMRLNWDVGGITLTSITGYDQIEQTYYEDADAGPFPVLHVTYGVESETLSEELRAIGSTEKSNWIVGAYFMNEDLRQDQTADILRVLRPDLGFDPDNFVMFSRHKTKQTTDSYAVFGQVEYRFTDRLTGAAGLRWTREKRDFLYDAVLEEPDFTVPLFTQTDSLDDEDLSGRLALDYALSDQARIYGSISKGFKAGGFNGGFLFQPTPTISYGPETVIAYEVGMKGDYLDRSLRLNVAGFYYDYSDMQVFSFINTGGLPTQVLTNAADAVIYGMEAELDWQVTDRFGLRFGLGLLDTELKDYQSAAGDDLSGNKLPQAPDYSLVGMTFYDIPLSNGAKVSLQADFSYQDDIFLLNDNNPILAQDGYGTVNARIAYKSQGESFEVAAWGRNLADEGYLVSGFDLADFGLYQLMRGSPRTYGLEVTIRF